ncbi:MAG TPA: sarcosine oxidase subunit delta [Actinomycetota bacterium]|nr:sarcosine oxidase subunit delta [Actinomycetota bacterium]
MTFEIPCPECGVREAEEFSFGGESSRRPPPDADERDLARYLFFRRNVAGTNIEWWFHRDGCRHWFLAERDTRDNVVRITYLPLDRPRS